MNYTQDVSTLTPEAVQSLAAKIVADKAVQKAKNSIRNKAKAQFRKDILARAAALVPAV
jgi:hypothetical protein